MLNLIRLTKIFSLFSAVIFNVTYYLMHAASKLDANELLII